MLCTKGWNLAVIGFSIEATPLLELNLDLFLFFPAYNIANQPKLIFPPIVFWLPLSPPSLLSLQDNVWDGALWETWGQWSAILVSTTMPGTTWVWMPLCVDGYWWSLVKYLHLHQLMNTWKATAAADLTTFQLRAIKAHSGPGRYSELLMSWSMPSPHSGATGVT